MSSARRRAFVGAARTAALGLAGALAGSMAIVASGCGGSPFGLDAAGHRTERTDFTSPGLGRPATAEEIARRDLLVAPDGAGLPPGRGDAVAGESVYVARCLRCHGLEGAGQPADRLVGGSGTLREARAIKTVGSYWPYATTLFDYVRRAMPYDRPGSLSNDEVYAVVAYLLAENDVVERDRVLDADALRAIRMPNQDGFFGETEAARQ